ncbi:hypothetical protein CRUP_011714 [Coryphaenoides rupestris]|nr:hypothetical protein CRUP_011714 [Coryphaenoides rupestris]
MDMPSTNLVLNNTLALVNMPSFSDTTTNCRRERSCVAEGDLNSRPSRTPHPWGGARRASAPGSRAGGGLLQLLEPLAGLPGVLGLEVIGRVGLAEQPALQQDPVVLLQHPRHLGGGNAKRDTKSTISLIFSCASLVCSLILLASTVFSWMIDI